MIKDGKSNFSQVKTFTLQLSKIIAAVYPNPTANAVNIQITGYNGSVTATLMNAQGAILHTEVFAVSSAASSYKLNINSKLYAGIYYINLTGDNLSQKLKVIVQ